MLKLTTNQRVMRAAVADEPEAEGPMKEEQELWAQGLLYLGNGTFSEGIDDEENQLIRLPGTKIKLPLTLPTF